MARGIEMRDWETPEGLAKLKGWCKCSKTEIARRIGISRATLDRWAAKSPKINNALMQGDVQHCNEVEDSLYTSCHDRTVVEIIHKMAYNASRGMYEEITETRERVIPGDPRAQQYYLERRNPNRWPETVKVEDEGGDENVNGFIPVSERMKTPEEAEEQA